MTKRLSFIVLLIFLMGTSVAAKPLEKIALQLKWTHAFQFAGYYAAKEKGFYQQAGLDVEIIEANPAIHPLEEVLSGRAQYGVGTSSLLLEYGKGRPVVVLGVVFQQSPYEIHAASDIQSVRDLIGKRMMIEPQSDELMVFLQKEGIPLDQITFIPHSFDPSDLVEGKVDAMSGYVSDEPYYFHQHHYPFQTFAPLSAGIDFYGDNLFTTQSEIDNHPERVEAFRQASMLGWKYAKEHREEVIRLIMDKYAPHLTSGYLRYESGQMIPLLQPNLIEIGYMNPDRWEHIAKTYAELNLLPKNLDLEKFIYKKPESLFPAWMVRALIIGSVVILLISSIALYVIRLNKRLRETQLHFSALFRSSPVGMAMIDYESGKFVDANPAVLKSSGYSREEYTNLTLWDATPEEFQAQMKIHFHSLDEKLQIGPIETECIRKNGSRYSVRTRCFLIFDRHGRKQVWAFIEDMSEQKKIEETLHLTTAKYEHLVENIAGEYCFYMHDTDGIVTYVSPSIVKMLGYTPDEAKAHFADFLTDHPLNEQVFASTESALKGEKQSTYLAHLKHKNGSHRWIEVNESPVFNEKGDVIGVEGIMHDVTALKESEFQLKLAASVFINAKEGISITDPNGTIIDVNQAYEELTGYPKEELIGKNSRILQSGRQSKEFYAAMWDKLLREGHWSGEVWNRHKNGELYAQILTISAIRDSDGSILNFVALMTDITAMKQHQKDLEKIAHYDVLTGLPNRLLLSDRLSRAIVSASRRGKKVAVLFLDLDGFKQVNDVYGHDAGDELLRVIAQEITKALREEDTLARIGGDEFIGVISNIETIEESTIILDRIIESVSSPLMVKGISIKISASIGVALYPDNGADPDMLLRNADQAMYNAKQSGKNKYCFYG